MRENAANQLTPPPKSGDPRKISCPDRHTFESTYDLYGALVRTLCRRMLRDPIEAEDASQEVFLRVFLKLHTFRGESALSSWLYRLATNQVLMWFRKNSRQFVSIDALQHPDGHALPEIVEPDLQLRDLPDRIDLQAAIEGLPKGYREVFILYGIHGYKHKEIASMLGCSVGNSKSQLYKARKRLRLLLGATPSRMNLNGLA